MFTDVYKVNKTVGNFVYLVYLLLCVCSHTTSGVVKIDVKTSMFEDHRSEKYTTRCIEMTHGS